MLGPLRRSAFGETEPAKPEKKKRRRTEDGDQARVVSWIREREPRTVVRCEQGEHRSPGMAARHRMLGMQPGSPDLIWFRSGGRTVWIETKTTTGKLSVEQIEQHRILRAAGHLVIVGYGSADIIAQLEALGP